MFPTLQAGHRDTFMHGCSKARCVSDEVIDDLTLRHEAIGIGSVIAAAWQLNRPVGNDEAEAVPAPTPCLADPAPLENDVLKTCGRELVTQGKPRLAGPDDNAVNGRLNRRGL